VIAFGCCVGSWERFNRYVLPTCVGPTIALSGQTSIAQAYNSMIDIAVGLGVDGLVLQHDDLEITDPAVLTKLAEAFADPAVALVGVAGGRGVSGLAWWGAETVGHQLTDTGMLDFGPRSGDVDLLEGSLLAFSPWALTHLRFDELPGFHGYDEIAFQAKALDRRVTVIDLDTHHHTVLGFDSVASEQQWIAGDQHFRGKWNL
jgi:hypothetical protein